MCSIFGAIGQQFHTLLDMKEFNQILAHIIKKSHARGRDGFGYRGMVQRELVEYKDPSRSHRVNFDDIPQFDYYPDRESSICLIGNYRAEPTTEFVKDKREEDQQPYTVGKWSIVHNGTIANDSLLRTHQYPSTVDSAAIIEKLTAQGLLFNDHSTHMTEFIRTIKALKGSFAILAMHDDFPDQMLVATNYRPIWYVEERGNVFFASAKEYFPDYLTPKALPPYTVASFVLSQGVVDVKAGPSFELFHGWVDVKTVSLYKELPDQPKALVIASGGLDSTVVASECLQQGMDVELIHFTYGCRAEEKEIASVGAIAHYIDVPLKLFPLNIYDPKDSRLFDKDSEIAGGQEGAEFAHEWVPARNLVMLSVATAYAEANGFNYIVLGNNLEEAGAYPDNEPEFVRRFNEVLPFAVGDGKRLEVLMPVGDLMKHEIVARGHAMGAPLHLTWSCYRNGEKHCGQCGPCYMRRKAFKINKLKEVILYER